MGRLKPSAGNWTCTTSVSRKRARHRWWSLRPAIDGAWHGGTALPRNTTTGLHRSLRGKLVDVHWPAESNARQTSDFALGHLTHMTGG